MKGLAPLVAVDFDKGDVGALCGVYRRAVGKHLTMFFDGQVPPQRPSFTNPAPPAKGTLQIGKSTSWRWAAGPAEPSHAAGVHLIAPDFAAQRGLVTPTSGVSWTTLRRGGREIR